MTLATAKTQSPPSTNSGRVLVVNSGSALMDRLVEICSRLGYDATMVQSYSESMTLLRHQSFDLVVMDSEQTRYPHEAVRAIRVHRPGIAVSFLVNWWSDSDIEREAAEAADLVINKPLRLSQVQVILQSATDTVQRLEAEAQ